ncbi:hypothetical protein D9M68_772730 [compost metagenome]
MDVVEYRFVFHPHPYEFADLEEAAPIDLVGRGTPPRQPVVLPLEQAVQAFAAAFRVGVMEPQQRLAAVPAGNR